MKTLRIAPGFELPLDAVTRRMAILAMSGAGKSNLAVVLAEAMFHAGIPWVAIDPKGDWWGVRSNTSGKGPGLKIPIFGGLHGDVPLEPTAGHVIGELIVNQRLTCVLDVSEFPDRQGMWLFLRDLGETLLKKNREALHLFLEEADEYLPQKPSEKGNLLKCLGVWQRVVKRGRFRGLGSTQISQRSASLHKDTLYQAEVMFALRVSGKGDKKAIEGWVEYHNAAADILASLPTLADGEGWVSSPAYLKKTERVQFDRRQTFDSGATPVLLKGTVRPATLADINLAEIQLKMSATIEKAKAEDPKELQKIVRELTKKAADLERQLAAKPQAVPAQTRTEAKTVEKRIMAVQAINRLESLLDKAAAIPVAVEEIRAAIREGKELNAANMIVPQPPAPARPTGPAGGAYAKHIKRAPKGIAVVTPQRAAGNGDLELTTPMRDILITVRALNVRGLDANRDSVARWLQIHPNGGRYGSNLAALRATGYLNGFELSASGLNVAGSPTTGIDAARLAIKENSARAIFDVLTQESGFTRDTLAAKLGIHPNGGRYGSNLAWLRTMGLIPERGTIELTEGAWR